MRVLACALLVIATAHAGLVCEPGDSYDNGETVCFCIGDGLGWTCAPKDRLGLSPENLLPKEKREVKETEETCEPGKFFKDYCNTCHCGDNGKMAGAVCTMMACDHNVWNKDGTLKNPEGIDKNLLLRKEREVQQNEDTCEPGKFFKNYCNTCHCGDNGKMAGSACTMMACDLNVWNKDGTLKNPEGIDKNLLLRKAREVQQNEDTCEPGKAFKYYCNSCFCGNNGLAACTDMYCDPNVWNKDGTLKESVNVAENPLADLILDNVKNCEPGKKFKYYCNSCACGSKGVAACTKMYCDPNVWNKDGSLKIDISNNPLLRQSRQVQENQDTCEPGKPFKYYCNTCFCGPEGKVAQSPCTKKGCNPAFWNKDGSLKLPNEILNNPLLRETREVEQNQDTCEPGKPFKYYCNNCFCGPEGKVGQSPCTKKGCNPAFWNKDGSLKLPNEILNNPLLRETREVEQNPDTCEPGKPFKYYCNTCFCGPEGKVTQSPCTKKACNPEFWNKDGSLKLPNEILNNPLLRETREVEQNQDTCEPGKPFKYYCNTCFCGPEGKVGQSPCTKKACNPEFWNKDGSLKLPSEILNNPLLRETREVKQNQDTCEPGKRFKYYCNSCFCGPEGKVAQSPCTKMACDHDVWNKDGTLKQPIDIATNPLLRKVRETEERCEAGKPFRRYCNQCVCSNDGKFDHSVCTQMFCEPGVWNIDGTLKEPKEIVSNPLLRKVRETEEHCEAGKPFRRYCNHCVCSNDGKFDHSVCTQMFCEPGVWNIDGTLKEPKEIVSNPLLRKVRETEGRCEAGKPFRRYCNHCVCSNDGKLDHSVCTQMLCQPGVWNIDGTLKEPTEIVSNPLLRKERSAEFLCQPGKVFMDDCNSCTCGKNGKSFGCTFMLCPPKDDTQVVAPQVCEPKKTFMIECNQCKCNDDGTKIACTKMACHNPAKRSVCVPNSTFKKDCNTCTCNSDGTAAACTLKACL